MTITFNSRVYYDSPSPGEHLLRCGIDTSNTYVHHHTTHQAVITCGEYLLRCGIDTSIYILHYNQFTIVQFDSPEQPRIRATAHHPQGLGRPLNSLLRLRENPYTTRLVFPVLWLTIRPLRYPERAGIPNYKEGANTPS